MTQVVVLLGPPGSGKTHIGQVLADQLGWTFEDSERYLLERYGSRQAFLDDKDRALAELEALFRTRIGDVPLVLESTGLTDSEMLGRFSDEFSVMFVRIRCSVERCVERVSSRPPGANLNNSASFTRNFHGFWERDVADKYHYAVLLDNEEDLSAQEIVDAVTAAVR